MPYLSNFNALPDAVSPSEPDSLKQATFSPYERKGVIVMAVAGVLSCTLVSTLLLYVIFSALSLPKRTPGSPTPFLRRQIAVFVICLLMSDLIQSISGVTQVKWAAENRIYEGRACTAQAVTLVMGDLGSTIWSCVIATHTFSGLALRKQWPGWVVCATVVIGWAFVIVLTTVGPTALAAEEKGPFFGLAGTWCFISSEYGIPRLGIHYIPMFVGSVVILVFYVLVFFVLRGTISFTNHHMHVSSGGSDRVLSRDRVVVAKRMLWYPVAYLTCALPIAIIRLVGLNSETVPDSVWIFAMFLLFLLGAADSVIYATTRTMINPVSFPTQMRRITHKPSKFSDQASEETIISDTPRKSSSIGCAGVCKYVDYRPDPNRPDDGEASLPKRSEEEYHEDRTGVIHITLERIQEVI